VLPTLYDAYGRQVEPEVLHIYSTTHPTIWPDAATARGVPRSRATTPLGRAAATRFFYGKDEQPARAVIENETHPSRKGWLSTFPARPW
jgi:hypothetical protein